MSREMILIPKLKYERLMNELNEEKNDVNLNIQPTVEKQLDQKEEPQTKEGNSNDEKLQKKSTSEQPFIKMKAKDFLKPKRSVTSKPIKQKWMAFHI